MSPMISRVRFMYAWSSRHPFASLYPVGNISGSLNGHVIRRVFALFSSFGQVHACHGTMDFQPDEDGVIDLTAPVNDALSEVINSQVIGRRPRADS